MALPYDIVICTIFIPLILCAPSEDEVRHLPGLNQPVPFKHYSGYLKASPDQHLHYWFVESQSVPENDPLVVWLNGGPGCSSMTGMLEELGPFRIAADGKTVITNYQYSWNKIANVLFIESPAGVGFSYSESRNYTTDDDQTCEANYRAVKRFLELFPEYKLHDFYITGESYAGVYVPMLAARVVDDPTIHFKGFAVGNGILDASLDLTSLVYYTFYHGLIGNVLWDRLKSSCCPKHSVYKCDFSLAAQSSRKCKQLVDVAYNTAWGIGLNPYNLYAPCAGGVPNDDGLIEAFSTPTRSVYALSVPVKEHQDLAYLNKLSNSVEDISLYVPCTNSSSVETYLNGRNVRKAIHAANNVKHWTSCSPVVSATYKKQYFDLKPQFQKVLGKGHRILVYNGDADMACNIIGNEWFVDGLRLKPLSRHEPWFYHNEKGEKQVSGFYKRYDQLDFVTVKGSGHYVPKDKPQQSFEMFERFIRNR